MLGGPDLLVWLVLAFGAAMLAGNVAALLRPPPRGRGPSSPAPSHRAPRRRTLAMAAIGALVSLWAVASLVR